MEAVKKRIEALKLDVEAATARAEKAESELEVEKERADKADREASALVNKVKLLEVWMMRRTCRQPAKTRG
jgi:hypothetical protein